jgi:hypothetical protein
MNLFNSSNTHSKRENRWGNSELLVQGHTKEGAGEWEDKGGCLEE